MKALIDRDMSRGSLVYLAKDPEEKLTGSKFVIGNLDGIELKAKYLNIIKRFWKKFFQM